MKEKGTQRHIYVLESTYSMVRWPFLPTKATKQRRPMHREIQW
jgi:hypothetical protein